MVIMLRHGPTQLNGTPQTDRIRGWIDLPLSQEGVETAQKAAESLKGAPVQHIYSSDLQRASKTAQLWADASGATVSTHQELRPWNLGALQGKHSKDVHGAIGQLVKHPDMPAPGGGESFNQFIGRFLPAIVPLVNDQQLHGVVSHIRNIKVMEALMAHPDKTGLDEKTLLAAPTVEPGEAIVVTPDGIQPLKEK